MIEVGVPLFDDIKGEDVIWVYYPTEKLEGGGWRCDLMTLHGGEVLDCRAGLRFSEHFLSSLSESPPK